MSKHQNPRDAQEPHTGKVANDTNKMGDQDATQLNQGQRTPDSRSDREAHVGGSNQSQSRRGTQGAPNPEAGAGRYAHRHTTHRRNTAVARG